MEIKTQELLKECFRYLMPPPEKTIDEWAEEKRILSPEGSAQPGKFDVSKTEYLRIPMREITSPNVVEVVLMFASQLGKTELILNSIGYFADEDPCPMALLQPSRKAAIEFAKERIKPLFRDTDALAKISKGTILRKEFPGGYLILISANSPDELASKPIRNVFCDEVDRYTTSAKTEGDPVSLAKARLKTFWNGKLILVSTPTITGLSKIEAEYNLSDMSEWCAKCPSCGEFHAYVWENLDFETLEMVCSHCGCTHTESEWKAREHRWISRQENKKIKGFHCNELASNWRTWRQIVDEFLEAKKDQEKLKVFYNTVLARSWEISKDSDFKNIWKKIKKRTEKYEAELPDGVLMLTAGVDVQGDRLEISVYGWGANGECWSIMYKKLIGNPAQFKVWNDLTELLNKKFKYSDDLEIPISLTCIDTGDHTTDVYKYLKKTPRVKGIKGMGGAIPAIHKSSTNNKYKLEIIILGVDALKDSFFSLINTKKEEFGYIHFPERHCHSDDFFKSLMSEQKQLKWNPETGLKKLQYVKIRSRNEGLDLHNYARAAMMLLNLDLDKFAEWEKTKRVEFLSANKTRKKRKRIYSKGAE